MIASNRAALFALLLLSACADDPNDPETWLKRLEDAHQTRMAVRELVRIGDPRAAPALIHLYETRGFSDPDLLDAILHFHVWSAIPTLIEQLSRADQNAAEKAATELGRLHAREAVAPLLAWLQKPLLPRVRRAGILALGQIGDPAAIEPLCGSLRQAAGEDVQLSAALVRALGQIMHPRGLTCLFYAALRNKAEDSELAFEIRVAIARLGKRVLPTLTQAIEGKSEDVDRMARQLGVDPEAVQKKMITWAGDLRATEAVPALLVRWEHASPRLRRAILSALGKIGDARGMDTVRGVLADARASVDERIEACRAAASAHESHALPVLVAMLADRAAPAALRQAAARAVGLLGGETEYQELAPLAESDLNLEYKESLDMLELPRTCAHEITRRHVRDLDDCYARALNDVSPKRREKAAYMLGTAQDRVKALSALLLALDNPGDARLVIIDSIQRLATIQCWQCGPRLQEVLERDHRLIEKLPSLAPWLEPAIAEMEIAQAALDEL